jgi:hypothetical protein
VQVDDLFLRMSMGPAHGVKLIGVVSRMRARGMIWVIPVPVPSRNPVTDTCMRNACAWYKFE